MNCVALLTDFGREDWYAGTMHGVIATIAPGVRIVDISHEIAPGDIVAADFTLAACYSYFPEGSVFCTVVDPGVGTSRRALCATDGRFFFVGPDNGIFTIVRQRAGQSWKVWNAVQKQYFLPSISHTFHGRDLFSPLAAHISMGVDPALVGPEISDMVCLPLQGVRFESSGTGSGNVIWATVVHQDRYGNLFVSLHLDEIKRFSAGATDPRKWICEAGGFRIKGLSQTFSDVEPGEPLFYFGSSGYLEIAVRGRSAAIQLGLRRGDSCHIYVEDMQGGL